MNNKKMKVLEVDEIIKLISNKDYGALITFEELQKFTSYDLSDELQSYIFKSRIMPRVKERLIETGKVLKSIKNKGYYMLKPNQIKSYTYRTYIKRPLKQFQKADIILRNTDVKLLNNKDFELHSLTINLNNELIDKTNEIINKEQYSIIKND